jgi:hypothetical protein
VCTECLAECDPVKLSLPISETRFQLGTSTIRNNSVDQWTATFSHVPWNILLRNGSYILENSNGSPNAHGAGAPQSVHQLQESKRTGVRISRAAQ